MMCSLTSIAKDITNYLVYLAPLIGAVLAGFAAWMAWIGWKREMRGQNRYKLAQRLLRNLRIYSELIHTTLSGFNTFSDAIEELKEPGILDEQKDLFSSILDAHRQLMKELAEQQIALYEDQLSAEIVWPKEQATISQKFQELFDAVSKLEYPLAAAITEDADIIYNRILVPPKASPILIAGEFDSKNLVIAQIGEDINSVIENLETMFRGKLEKS